MKAIVQNEYGSPDVLEFREIDRPVVEDDEVALRIAGIPAFVPLDQATERWEDSLDKLANRLEG